MSGSGNPWFTMPAQSGLLHVGLTHTYRGTHVLNLLLYSECVVEGGDSASSISQD